MSTSGRRSHDPDTRPRSRDLQLTVEYVDDAGHFVADDRPDVVVRTALEFLAAD